MGAGRHRIGGVAAVEKVEVVRLSPSDAAQAVAGVEKRDPRGITTPADMSHCAERGHCFELRTTHSKCTYILVIENGQAWIQAAKSEGDFAFVDVMAGIVEEQVRDVCHSIAFQTSRPGFVRKAKKHGYTVAGWILRKDIKK